MTTSRAQVVPSGIDGPKPLTWNEGAEIEVAMLALGGFTMQLVGYHAAGADPVAPGHNHPGNPHLCIDVDDVDVLVAWFRLWRVLRFLFWHESDLQRVGI